MFNVLLQKRTRNNTTTVQVTKETNNLALRKGRQVRDGGTYGCAVPIRLTPTLIRAWGHQYCCYIASATDTIFPDCGRAVHSSDTRGTYIHFPLLLHVPGISSRWSFEQPCLLTTSRNIWKRSYLQLPSGRLPVLFYIFYYRRRLCRSAWVGFLSPSVCPQHNSKTNDPKVFKLGT